jgi:hypothetical protein
MMITQHGTVLNFDQFRPPSDEIARELLEKGQDLYESLRPHMKPAWRSRPLAVLIVDNPRLNAIANCSGDSDCIYIFRGVLEKLYGNLLGLLTIPEFLPWLGNTNGETARPIIPADGFTAIPLLLSASEAAGPILFPSDEKRRMVAICLAELGLEFLIYHELGHVVGGHLEISKDGLLPISEFAQSVPKSNDCHLSHVLEWDADAFACFITSPIHTDAKLAEILCDAIRPNYREPKDFAVLTYLVAIGMIFRLLDPNRQRKIKECESSHPHPAIRASLAAASMMARGTFEGRLKSESLNTIAAESIGNLETVWADLFLSDKEQEPAHEWLQSLTEAAMRLFQSWGDKRSFLDNYARVSRRWDNWQWPESK